MSDPLSLSATKGTHHSPSSDTTAEYRIRCDPNPLCEDPDIEEDVYYRITPGSQVTDDQLDTCASHFTLYYGVWSAIARYRVGFWAKHGNFEMLHSRRKKLLIPTCRAQDTYESRTTKTEELARNSEQCTRNSHDRPWRANRPLFCQPVEAR